MRLFPTKIQWSNWKFLSKLGAISAYAGIISMLITVFVLLLPSEKNVVGDVYGNENIIVQGISKGSTVIINEININKIIEEVSKIYIQEINNLEGKLEGKQDIFNKEVLEVYAEIDKLKQQLLQKENQIRQIISQYQNTDLSNTSNQFQIAFNFFKNGNLEKALEELKEPYQGENNKQLSDVITLKAYIYYLKGDLKDAEGIYQYALSTNPSFDVHMKIANFYLITKALDKAEFYFTRGLSKVTSDKEKATALNNLANLNSFKGELSKASTNYQKALEVYQNLSKDSQEEYELNIAGILNNIANTYSFRQEHEKAEVIFEKALKIYRKQKGKNHEASIRDMANTINNLCLIWDKKNEFVKAEKGYEEVLTLYQTQMNNDSLKILPLVANTLMNKGLLYSNWNKFEKAEVNLAESEEIYRSLAKINPYTYASYVGWVLHLSALLQDKMIMYNKAEHTFLESLLIYQKISEINPKYYISEVINVQLDLGAFYVLSIKNEKLSLKFTYDAIDLLIHNFNNYEKNKYYKKASKILKHWNIDINKYIDEKYGKTNYKST